VVAFASSLRDGRKTLLDGSFDRLQRPGCIQILEQHEQARWSDILFEAIHISLHDKLKRIVPCALLLEDAGDGGEESCGLLAELGKAFSVLLNSLSPRWDKRLDYVHEREMSGAPALARISWLPTPPPTSTTLGRLGLGRSRGCSRRL
jgi:hypothetical protein